MDILDERRYAWLMLRAAREAHATLGSAAEQISAPVRDQIDALLREALEAGLDRAELVAALADLGGRLLMVCDPTRAAGVEEVCLT